jgi:hypothetical protein
MQRNEYDKIIDRLRQIKPVNDSAAGLTDEIMQRIETVPKKKNFWILIKASTIQWNLIYGIRILTTSAAVLLIGFFIYQQWEFSYKSNQIKTRITKTQQTVVESPSIQSRQELIQRIYDETGNRTNGIYIDLHSINLIPIDRNTLPYIMKLSNEIKKKNRNYRQNLQKFISDQSVFKIQKENDNENPD